MGLIKTRLLSAVLLCAQILNVRAYSEASFSTSAERWDDSDLHKFVTRPDLRPPIFDIVRNDERFTSPGYIFVSPYSDLRAEGSSAATEYIAQQAGPMIYDRDGNLVWSGSEVFRHMNAHDFKADQINGTTHLTLISFGGSAEDACHILNSSYQPVASFQPVRLDTMQDMHEFSVLDNGRTALMTSHRTRDASEADRRDYPRLRSVVENIFHEVDVRTSKVLFEWASLDHVPLSETRSRGSASESQEVLDYFHLNSVAKTPSGDYLISARHADCVYLVSGVDGSVIWRLGGSNSSFMQQGFNFSRQHDARLHSQNDSTIVISFLDNAAWDVWGHDSPSSAQSSMLLVALHTDTTPMTASLLHRYPRPDGEYTGARGNMQILPNGNVFGGWGDNAYITEHTPEGEVVFEAIFMSSRFQNYRAYKLNFTGQPVDAPVLKSDVHAAAHGRSANTVIHVSWNGATEVVAWRFSSVQGGRYVHLGTASKAGFETAFVAQGYHAKVLAEALHQSGHVLGQSAIGETELPLGWNNSHADLTNIHRMSFREVVIGENVSLVILSFLAGAVSVWMVSRTSRLGRVLLGANPSVKSHKSAVE